MDVEKSPEELELMQQVSRGDERAFAALFSVYQPLLYTYVYRVTKSYELTDEIVQDVFLKIWMSRESLSNITNFKNYLFIVSRNHTINFLKKLAAEGKNKSEYIDYMKSAGDDKDPAAVHYGTLIDEAINRLPPQQQKVYLLSRHEGLKYADIARELGIAPRTVKSYMKLAIESITAFVGEKAISAAGILLSAHLMKFF